MAEPYSKIPLGTQYISQDDFTEPLTLEQEESLLFANITIDRYASNNTYYDALGEVPVPLKLAAMKQYEAIESGEVSLTTGEVSGSFSIGSWSESADNTAGTSSDSTTINMSNKCKTILQAYGYLYVGNII